MEKAKQIYGLRDIEALEPFYSKHLAAMTIEGLHSKGAIAAELAHLDKIASEQAALIGQLMKGIAITTKQIENAEKENPGLKIEVPIKVHAFTITKESDDD